MIELLRRIILLAGLFTGVWFYFLTPPALLQVERVDLARRYDQEYRQRRGSSPLGVSARGRELVAQLTDPGSVDAYIARKTENRLLHIAGADWERVLQGLVPDAPAFTRTTDAPFAALMPEFNRLRSTTGWANAFLALDAAAGTRYIELTYIAEPASSSAPARLVHPSRPSSWIYPLIGLVGYVALPWRRRAPNLVTLDRVPAVYALDAMGAAIATVFVALPLGIAGSTAAAFTEDLSVTVLLWSVALIGVGLTVWAAANAARAIVLDPDALQLSLLTGTREYRYSEIQRVRPLALGRMTRAGVEVTMQDGRQLRLPSRGWLRFGTVLDALARHGFPLTALEGADRFASREPALSPSSMPAPPPRRTMSVGRSLVIAMMALVATLGYWFWQRPTPPPNAENWKATHENQLRAALDTAVASPGSATSLDLSGADFIRLPEGIERLTALRTLSLNNSPGLDLKTVLTQLAVLPALERLELAECAIAELPAEIGGLTHLTSLLVWGNQLKTLPPEIGRLTVLDWINLHQNEVVTLPAEMAQLTALTSLDLGQNGLRELPAVVCQLGSLTSLDLSRNVDLTLLPACVGNLKRLEFLGLAFAGGLRELPPELAQLTALKEITGLGSAFVATPQMAALRQALPNTTISGLEEGQLINRMQEMTAEGDRIQKEEDAKRRRNRIR